MFQTRTLPAPLKSPISRLAPEDNCKIRHTHLLDLLRGNRFILGIYGSLGHNDDIQSFFPGTVLEETENEHPQTPKPF